MPSITVRNIPEEVHRAIRVRAARHGRSTEAEVREILAMAATPDGRLKLGTLLSSIAREAGAMTDGEADRISEVRDKTPAQPMEFE